jgi:hypothetical protein
MWQSGTSALASGARVRAPAAQRAREGAFELSIPRRLSGDFIRTSRCRSKLQRQMLVSNPMRLGLAEGDATKSVLALATATLLVGHARCRADLRSYSQAGQLGTRNASTRKSIRARTLGVRCLRLGYAA